MGALFATVLAGLAMVGPTPAGSATGHVIAAVHTPVSVLAAPAGPTVARLGTRTRFGSPRTLSVLARSGRWLEVATAGLPGRRYGWVNADAAGLTFSVTPLSITVSLGTKTLELRSGSRVLRRFPVGVGAPDSPTPTGRFTVTDELRGGSYSPDYGCCILALSARQTHLPAGWTGGDQIAIHGTNDPATIDHADSAGCIHARDDDLRYLMEHVPLGTPVTIAR
ncbi:MAG TPA: L,D-transpeptidase [Gaiellaceae bacterium]|jgi:lipoprotein-anchoring transpeptidase ErfK/SrfK|nr:L,D-transpeptidase [Gaiellaceae bacterium]